MVVSFRLLEGGHGIAVGGEQAALAELIEQLIAFAQAGQLWRGPADRNGHAWAWSAAPKRQMISLGQVI